MTWLLSHLCSLQSKKLCSKRKSYSCYIFCFGKKKGMMQKIEITQLQDHGPFNWMTRLIANNITTNLCLMSISTCNFRKCTWESLFLYMNVDAWHASSFVLEKTYNCITTYPCIINNFYFYQLWIWLDRKYNQNNTPS